MRWELLAAHPVRLQRWMQNAISDFRAPSTASCTVMSSLDRAGSTLTYYAGEALALKLISLCK